MEDKVSDINTLYRQVPALLEPDERVESLDEMTGVQALERKHPGLPLQPGRVERREFEYIRHGTLAFTFNFDVATGQVTAVTAQPTRTEQDFLAHIQARSAAEPTVRKWHYRGGNRPCQGTNCDLSLVRAVHAPTHQYALAP